MTRSEVVAVLRETTPDPDSSWRAEPTGWKGLSQSTLDDAGVECLDERGWAVPYRLPSGVTAYSKRFSAGGESWYDPPPSAGFGLIPYGLESVPWESLRDDDVLVLAEGESDALACRQYIAELDGRRVFCLGLPGAGTWRSEWMSYVRRFACVYVIPDADDAGRRMAAKVRTDCRWARIVELPAGDDLRGLLQRDGGAALLPLLDEASWLLQLDLGMRVCASVEQLDDWMRRSML